MKTYTTSPFVDGYVFLEGPRWHDNRLWVSDIWAHRVYGISQDGRAEVAAEVPGRPSGLGFMPDGTPLIVSMTDRCVYKLIGGALELHADLSGSVRADLNDMVVAPNGRAYVGNMGYDLFDGADPAPAEISLIEPDGSHRIVADELNFPNGMVITNSGTTLVVSESFGERMSAFDITADGGLDNRRVYAELPGLVPDGICLDVDGNIWVAGASGGAFVQVNQSGEIIARIDTTDEAAIACQLGGADGRTLYCLIFTGGIEEILKGEPGARIETAWVESAAAGSP
ncbi:MAG: sugar lactone lactonase YvrE [Gammaproteobacteria bacterium]|jgi:sugar lactone lactonase YvrE